jgi:sulfide:quinone oxidoreductase
MTARSQRLRIAVAGGGVAGVELALALHHLAAELVQVTILSPDPSFQCKALRTAQPFSADHMRCHALCDLADELGAELIIDSVMAVDADRHAVLLSGGELVHYDCLVLATGGHHREAFSRALTFTGDESTLPFNDLLADLEEHWTHSVAFVVPPGVTWPLPLYELAIMTSRAVRSMAIDDLRIQLVSPEPMPLAVFGRAASAAVGDLLREANIDFRGETYARAMPSGVLELLPGGERLDAERVVSLPTIDGPGVGGVPADEAGFILIDDRGRVPGLADVFAAGDGTTFPIKQGGIACQLADVIAEQLAARAGADVEPQPFRPILRGRLLTGHGAQYLEHAIPGGAGADPPSELQLWSASRKVHGQYLSPWLDAMDRAPSPPPSRSPRFARGQCDERDLDGAGMDLDPYSPLPRR